MQDFPRELFAHLTEFVLILYKTNCYNSAKREVSKHSG